MSLRSLVSRKKVQHRTEKVTESDLRDACDRMKKHTGRMRRDGVVRAACLGDERGQKNRRTIDIYIQDGQMRGVKVGCEQGPHR